MRVIVKCMGGANMECLMVILLIMIVCLLYVITRKLGRQGDDRLDHLRTDSRKSKTDDDRKSR